MPATTLFNATVTAFAINATDELGLLDELQEAAKIDLGAFIADRGLHAGSVQALAEVLMHAGIVEPLQAHPLVLTKGQQFDDVWQHKGYFRWLVRGYGGMLSTAADFCDPAFRANTEPMRHRDGRAIALSGKDYGHHFVDPAIDRVIDACEFTVGIDLGCGSANRVIRLARRHPGKRFIGVDVDSGAIAVAREAVAAAGLTDRVTIVHDDVRKLADHPEYANADLAFSFFLGHDFWPADDCVATLAHIRHRLPAVRDFLFSDTYRSPSPQDQPGATPEIFTLGFELTHALMGQHIPTPAEWLDLFDQSAWRLHHRWPLGISHSDVFHLIPR